jgi:four helix bundle protein
MSIKHFEEMQVWQDARVTAKNIYDYSSRGKLKRDFSLRDQIQRASVSVMSNIAEGYERDSTNEFIKFLGYSKGSIGEVRSLLCVALDRGYIDEMTFKTLYDSSINISTQLANFIKYLKQRKLQNKNKL